MGLKDKFDKYFRDSYFQKYGDRITSAQGTVMSVKTEEKNYVIFHKLIVNIIIKPDAGRSAIKADIREIDGLKNLNLFN